MMDYCVVVVLLVVAAYNARWGRRKLIALVGSEPRGFMLTAGVKAALGLVVVFMGVMLVVDRDESNRRSGSASTVRPDEFSERSEGDACGRPESHGTKHLSALADAASAPVNADFVRLTFRYQDDSTVGPWLTLSLAASGSGVFLGQGPFLTLEGQWRVEVEIRRAGVDDTKAFFDVRPAGPLADINIRVGAWANPARA